MYCRGKHNQLHIPNNSAPPPETKHDLQEVTGKNKVSTPSPAGAVTTHDCPAELPLDSFFYYFKLGYRGLASGAHRIHGPSGWPHYN